MPSEAQSRRSVARRGLVLCCRSLLDMLYSLAVFILLILVVFFAYVITLEEAPVPGFIVRLLENRLEARGAALSMEGIRITPSGRISIENPEFRSTKLQDTIARAEAISFKIHPPLLLFGHLEVTEAQVVNATLLAPAVLSQSGVPETLADRIDLRLIDHGEDWNIEFAKFRFKNLSCFASGLLQKELLRPRDAQPRSLTTLLVEGLPKVWELEKQLERIDGAEARIELQRRIADTQQFDAHVTVSNISLPHETKASKLELHAAGQLESGLTLQIAADQVAGPRGFTAKGLRLAAEWNALPTPENWQPATLHLAAKSIRKQEQTIASALAVDGRLDGSRIDFEGLLSFAGKPLSLSGAYQLDSKRSEISFSGEIGKTAPELVALAADRPEVAQLITIHESPLLQLSAAFDEEFQPLAAQAELDAGPLTIRGARFDHALATASVDGPQIRVPDIFVRSGKQEGWIGIEYNLESRFRRFLIDGLFDPNTLNGWFKPWWADFWNNFQFPDGGFHCLLDSQAIHLRPETLRITGLGASQNLGIRGERMDYLRTRMHILLRYFDLYDIDLRRPEGIATGEAQIYAPKDPRDGKEKLAGLWIDATSSIDPGIGPTVLYEIDQDIIDILKPYTFESPPTISALTTTKRIRDEYQYQAELDIGMPAPFTFFDYPLDGLEAEVFLANDRIQIIEANAALAGGNVAAEADILGDEITLDARVSDSNFGGALEATLEYFAADEPELRDEVEIDRLSDYGGLIQLDFSGRGIVGDPLSYQGEGSFDIREAELGKFQLFGLLSKVLEATPLRFSTLSFQNASGEFSAHETYLEFPYVRVTGPAARVTGDGRYYLDRESLDFKAKLFPFRQSSMPIMTIVGVVLEPLSHALEVTLTGSLGDPKWSLFGGPGVEASE